MMWCEKAGCTKYLWRVAVVLSVIYQCATACCRQLPQCGDSLQQDSAVKRTRAGDTCDVFAWCWKCAVEYKCCLAKFNLAVVPFCEQWLSSSTEVDFMLCPPHCLTFDVFTDSPCEKTVALACLLLMQGCRLSKLCVLSFFTLAVAPLIVCRMGLFNCTQREKHKCK